jgi:Zn-dependent protease
VSERRFSKGGLRVGRIRGIRIWIHWTLLVLAFYWLYRAWLAGGGSTFPLVETLIWIGVAFGSILFHELGHCYAAFRVGGGAADVILWPLGGLALCDAPRNPASQLRVAAGGPLASLALLVPSFLAIWIAGAESPWSHRPVAADSLWIVALRDSLLINGVVAFFNLIPLYPMDGGRILLSLVWARTGSFGRAGRITLFASWATFGVVIIASLVALDRESNFLLLAFLIWCVLKLEEFRHRLHDEESESPLFGYDFSRGYTSLERSGPGPKAAGPRPPRFWERLRRRREQRRRERQEALRGEVDRLLEKISFSGLASLSPRERRFLERASREIGAPKAPT